MENSSVLLPFDGECSRLPTCWPSQVKIVVSFLLSTFEKNLQRNLTGTFQLKEINNGLHLTRKYMYAQIFVRSEREANRFPATYSCSLNFYLHTGLEITYKEKFTKLKGVTHLLAPESGCHNHEFAEQFEIPTLFNSSTTFNNTQSHPVHLQLKIRYSKTHISVWMASVLIIIKVSTSAVRKKQRKLISSSRIHTLNRAHGLTVTSKLKPYQH